MGANVHVDFVYISELLKDAAVFKHPDIVGYVQLTVDDDNEQILLGARYCFFDP